MWRHSIAACAATLVLGMPGAAWAQALPDNACTIDRLIDMTRVSSPALSPDGAHVLFTRSDLDWSKNKRNSRLWIANADGSDARPFTAEPGDGAARWSPDGRYVAFLRAAARTATTPSPWMRGPTGRAAGSGPTCGGWP
jgi:dipeptidyl aminopeptidase/acylaminoacyl peptidase